MSKKLTLEGIEKAILDRTRWTDVSYDNVCPLKFVVDKTDGRKYTELNYRSNGIKVELTINMRVVVELEETDVEELIWELPEGFVNDFPQDVNVVFVDILFNSRAYPNVFYYHVTNVTPV